MKLHPFDFGPNLSGDKIPLRHIQAADIKDLVEISFYNAVQASTVQQAKEMQARINKDIWMAILNPEIDGYQPNPDH